MPDTTHRCRGDAVRASAPVAPDRAVPRPAGRTTPGSPFRACLLLAALVAAADDARGQDPAHGNHALGTVTFSVSCDAAVQEEFNRAVALLHHMTYPEARAAFRHVAERDPRCAMARWGIAMTLFQPLWPTRPGPGALEDGWRALETAGTLPATARERAFLAAAAAFFREPASPDYWLRIRRWEGAQARVFAAFPDDDEAAAFYALAHLATAPADRVSRAQADRAADVLLAVYRRNPDHPGALHYLVHANDVPGREHELPEIARRYEAAAPRNPHALHMPTHIYTRLGDWDGVVRGNVLAASAALEHPAGDRGELVWDEFPHAIEYLVYAYLQQGADDSAAAALTRLRATAALEPTFKTAFHLASTPARYALERHAWDEAARLVPREPATLPWDRFAWPEAISQFARGLGAAHGGDRDGARAAVARVADLEAATERSGERLFARHIRVLHLALRAWLAQADGRPDTAVALMREAAALETATPKHAVTPGPTMPAHELLGDLLLEQRRPAEALAAYRRALELYPRRFNSVLGAARAARASRDTGTARAFYRELLAIAAVGNRATVLSEARAFLDSP
jgi:tetratricopeptide (TPR) repeat protein